MEGRQGKGGAPVEAEAVFHRSGSLIFIAQGRGLISVLHATTFQFLDIIKVGPLPRECRRVWVRECMGVLPRLGLLLLRTRSARPGGSVSASGSLCIGAAAAGVASGRVHLQLPSWFLCAFAQGHRGMGRGRHAHRTPWRTQR